jgi:hypothetical protein
MAPSPNLHATRPPNMSWHITKEVYQQQIAQWHDTIVEATGGYKKTYDKIHMAWRDEKTAADCGIAPQVFDTVYKAIEKMEDLHNRITRSMHEDNPDAPLDETYMNTVYAADCALKARLG